MITTTAEHHARAGAELLDQLEPGWHRRVDVDKLNLSLASCCVLGQLYGNYGVGLATLKEIGQRTFGNREWMFNRVLHGFLVKLSPMITSFTLASRRRRDEYDALRDAWRALVADRRARDDLTRRLRGGGKCLFTGSRRSTRSLDRPEITGAHTTTRVNASRVAVR